MCVKPQYRWMNCNLHVRKIQPANSCGIESRCHLNFHSWAGNLLFVPLYLSNKKLINNWVEILFVVWPWGVRQQHTEKCKAVQFAELSSSSEHFWILFHFFSDWRKISRYRFCSFFHCGTFFVKSIFSRNNWSTDIERENAGLLFNCGLYCDCFFSLFRRRERGIKVRQTSRP